MANLPNKMGDDPGKNALKKNQEQFTSVLGFQSSTIGLVISLGGRRLPIFRGSLVTSSR